MKFPFSIKAIHVLLLLFLAVGCKKDPQIEESHIKRDTISIVEVKRDTLTPILKIERDDNQLIWTVDATKLPIKLIHIKDSPEEQLVVRLQNFNQPMIKATIKPEQAMNIRFNQIRLPDNSFDGPFGLDLSYKTTQKGEYWLVVSRNLMTSGNPIGKFFLKIE